MDHLGEPHRCTGPLKALLTNVDRCAGSDLQCESKPPRMTKKNIKPNELRGFLIITNHIHLFLSILWVTTKCGSQQSRLVCEAETTFRTKGMHSFPRLDGACTKISNHPSASLEHNSKKDIISAVPIHFYKLIFRAFIFNRPPTYLANTDCQLSSPPHWPLVVGSLAAARRKQKAKGRPWQLIGSPGCFVGRSAPPRCWSRVFFGSFWDKESKQKRLW